MKLRKILSGMFAFSFVVSSTAELGFAGNEDKKADDAKQNDDNKADGADSSKSDDAAKTESPSSGESPKGLLSGFEDALYTKVDSSMNDEDGKAAVYATLGAAAVLTCSMFFRLGYKLISGIFSKKDAGGTAEPPKNDNGYIYF